MARRVSINDILEAIRQEESSVMLQVVENVRALEAQIEGVKYVLSTTSKEYRGKMRLEDIMVILDNVRALQAQVEKVHKDVRG